MTTTSVTLSGFVYDNAGNAVQDATVAAYASADNATSAIAGLTDTTDANGRWDLTTTDEAKYPMDIRIVFGSSVRWIKAGIGINVTRLTVSGASVFGEDDTGVDVTMYGATSGSFLLWDESEDALKLTDSTPLKIGDGGDMTIYHDGSNSYITNATGALKLATETSGIAITIGHSTSEVTVADNLTVTGDLTVSGTTTTVDTTNTVVKDSLIELNTGASSNSNDLGVVMERGSTGNNAIIAWDESADGFVVGTTTATGASTGDLTIATAPFTAAAIAGTTIDASTDFTIGDTVVTDGVITDTSGLQLAANLDINGTVDISSTLTLGTVAAAGTDTDKFLVLDSSGNVDYRTGAEVLSDIGAAGSKSYGIANDNAVEIDGADIADDEYARFTANGLESRTSAEVAADIEGSIDAVGALNGGSITSGFGNIDTGSSTITTTGAVATGTLTAGGVIKTDDATNATSTTDGSLQTDGGLSVVKDAVFGDDVTLITDSAVLNLGVGSDVKLTHDGTTGGTLSGTPVIVDSLGASALTNDTYSGLVLGFIANGTIAIGNAVYVHTADGRVAPARANAIGTMPAIGVAVTGASDGAAVKILVHGIYNDSDGFGGDLTEGATMYVDDDTAGLVTATIPDADGEFVQVMGMAVGPRDVYINPSLDIIERD